MLPSLRHPSHVVRAALAGSLMVLFLAAGCSEDAPARTALVTTLPEASWTACSTDNACEARWLPCRGWRAINRDHGSQVEAWYAHENREYLARADCDGRPLAAPTAFCRARQCTLE